MLQCAINPGGIKGSTSDGLFLLIEHLNTGKPNIIMQCVGNVQSIYQVNAPICAFDWMDRCCQ